MKQSSMKIGWSLSEDILNDTTYTLKSIVNRVPDMIFFEKYILLALKNEEFWRKNHQNRLIRSKVIKDWSWGKIDAAENGGFFLNRVYDVTKSTFHKLYTGFIWQIIHNCRILPILRWNFNFDCRFLVDTNWLRWPLKIWGNPPTLPLPWGPQKPLIMGNEWYYWFLTVLVFSFLSLK